MAKGDVGVYLEAQRFQVLHDFPVSFRDCLAFSPAQAIDENVQGSLSGDFRVQLSYRAGGGVPGVGEKRQLFLGTLLVQLLEAGLGQVDLAPDLKPWRRLLGHGERYALYSPQVLSDVLAA